MKILILLFIILISTTAYSSSPTWIGFGSTTHNFLTAQSDEKGTTKVVEFAPTIFLGTSIPFLYSGMYLSPAIGYAKFFTKDNTSRYDLILQYHLSQTLSSSFLFQYGFSNYISKIGGSGGTVELNNGNSTSTFYTPSAAKTSYTASLDLGGEYVLSSSLSARLQFSVMRFLSSDRRRVSHLTTINYFF